MRILIPLLTLLLAGCGGDGGSEAGPVDPGAAAAAAPAKPVSSSGGAVAPCELLTEEMVRDYLQPGEVEIAQEAGDTRQSVYCQYQWHYPASDEELQQVAEARMQWIEARHEARRKGQPPPPAPSFPSRDSLVFLTVMTPFEDEQRASASFETMVTRLREGITVHSEELGEVEFKGGELVDVDGLGDRAIWDPKASQLSVLTGTQLFHLKVRLAGDEDARAVAERMATDLVGRF